MNKRQASQYSGFPEDDILRAAKAEPPRLRAYWLGPHGPVMFARSDLDSWVDSMDNMNPENRAARKRTTAGK